jgi:dGTPase
MQWQTLLSAKREPSKDPGAYDPNRSEFEKDYDRVIFSAAFRRLQDKTQVIPLPESDFVHSRLTHSLEVSSVGRSLGKMVGNELLNRNPTLGKYFTAADFSSVIATACLAHDIGNPPFGHSGEASISNYFRNGSGSMLKEQISNEARWHDLTTFEGNANGFRILTRNNNKPSGVKLTYATLAAFTKYPTQSLKTEDTGKRVSQKKYGYFQAEADTFREIFTHLQIPALNDYSFCRHPLAFLVEAADDICYRVIDFEDGIRIGLVPFKEGEEILISLISKNTAFNLERYRQIDEWEKIGFLRAMAINNCIQEAAKVFLANEASILNGDFDSPLVESLDTCAELDTIIDLSVKNIYRSRNVLEIEAAGFRVVAALLDTFITAVNDLHFYGKALRKEKPYSEKVISLLPAQFLSAAGLPQQDLYHRVLQICEFVAGMTDGYAVSLYRKLTGIELPE